MINVKFYFRENKDAMKELYKEVEGSCAKIGILKDVKYPTGERKNLISIAITQEFGDPSRHIPKRPFLTEMTFDDELRNEIKSNQENLNKRLEKDGGRGVLNSVSKIISNRIKHNIEDPSHFVPNAPSTIKHKGFNNPLTETGFLAKNIYFKVENK